MTWRAIVKSSTQASVNNSIPRTGDRVALGDLRVGDELICKLETGGTIVARVKRLKRDTSGALVGFFPCAQLGLDSSVAIDVRRIEKVWRAS